MSTLPTASHNVAESSRQLRREISSTAADAIEALDNNRTEYARSLLLALLAVDDQQSGRYSAELTVHRAARQHGSE
jgi:hypothetical protein